MRPFPLFNCFAYRSIPHPLLYTPTPLGYIINLPPRLRGVPHRIRCLIECLAGSAGTFSCALYNLGRNSRRSAGQSSSPACILNEINRGSPIIPFPDILYP